MEKNIFLRLVGLVSLLNLLLFCSLNNSYAADPESIISQMLDTGYNQEQADSLLAHWSTAKHSMVKYAKMNQGNKKKLGVLAKICQNRFNAREDAVMGAIKDAMAAGYSKPINALVPTGGWKKALSIDPDKNAQNAFDYIIEASNADIDETFFGKLDATEYVTEQASFRYAQRALGRKLARDKAGYQQANSLLIDAEVTFFPREPQGRYSPDFEAKFPTVVLESYRGPEGQRNLDVGYLVNKQKGLADIIHYDSQDNIIRIRVVKNQPAESVLENINDTRYSTLQRISKAKQDYSHKYVDQVIKKGLSGDDRIEWAAKMLERMYGDESAITGRSLDGNQLFEDAKNVKRIMRTIKDPAARAAAIKKDLHSKSLDDFVRAAEKEMKWMDFQNRQRAAWMLDDDIGRMSQGARLGTLLKAISLLSDGATIADAYLKASDGDKLHAVSRALLASLAADIAGSTVGKVVGTQVGAGVATVVGRGAGVVAGGAAGIASGVIAGAIAAYVVDGTWQWTEEGVNNMLRGYKGDDAVKKIFLGDKNMIAEFLKMTPDEMKKKIEKEWDVHYQFGGAYVGRMTGDDKDMKQYMLQKAVEQQFLLKKGKLEAQIYGNILRQELEKLVQKMEAGKLTPDELAKIRAKFGKNTSAMIKNKLENDPQYTNYKKLLEKVNAAGGKPGLVDSLKSNFDFRSKQEIEKDMNSRFQRIIEIYDELDGQLYDYWTSVSAFYAVLNTEGAIDTYELTGTFNDASINLSELKTNLNAMQRNVWLFLSELSKILGQREDLSQYNYKKGEVSSLLTAMIERVNAAIARFSELEHIMRLKQKADEMNEKGEKELKKKEETKDDNVPAFVKKSKGNNKISPPAFVKKSKPKKSDSVPDLFGRAKDDYEIVSMAFDTVDVKGNNKIYERIKDIDNAAVIIRIRGEDHIVEGYNALQLLVEKGKLYHVKNIGYVQSERKIPVSKLDASTIAGTYTCKYKWVTCDYMPDKDLKEEGQIREQERVSESFEKDCMKHMNRESEDRPDFSVRIKNGKVKIRFSSFLGFNSGLQGSPEIPFSGNSVTWRKELGKNGSEIFYEKGTVTFSKEGDKIKMKGSCEVFKSDRTGTRNRKWGFVFKGYKR